MAKIETREVTIDAVRSLVRHAGPDDATEAVVFLHGNPGSSEDWTHLLERTGDFARAIAPDMPGYGKADRPAEWPYTVASYATHFGGVLDALGVKRAHLVLHDFGGPWGLTWASEHPTAVASVVLVDIGVLRGYRWHKYARVWQTPILGEISQRLVTRGLYRATLDAENPRPFPREFVDRMYDDSDAGMKRAVLALYRNTRAISEMSDDLARKLTPHRFPALVLWGEGDPYVPSRFAHEQGDVFAVKGVHVLERCGHWPFIDEPDRADELVLPFLREQLAK